MRERKSSLLEQQMFEDMVWAKKSQEVQKHAGQLVIVHRKRVIAFGTDQDSLLRQAAAQENCSEADLVVVAVPGSEFQEIPH